MSRIRIGQPSATTISAPRSRIVVSAGSDSTAGFAFAPVALGAGGWVVGNVVSPDGLTRLGRTDTYGAYRWDSVGDQWVQAVTSGSLPVGDATNAPRFGVGVNSLAASNAVAWMQYRDGFFKSTDRGRTWSRKKTITLEGPNDAYRWWGNRMAIDPNDDSTLIVGTQGQGLYFTRDGGTTWTQVAAGTLAWGTATKGIINVAIDPSGNWWASPHGQGVWESTDHGASWSKISSDSDFVVTRFLRARADGTIFVVGIIDALVASESPPADQRVFRWAASTWTNITPSTQHRWHTLACDPLNAGHVMVHGDGGHVAYSTDSGATWSYPAITDESDADVAWHAPALSYGNLNATFETSGEINFDPVVSGRVWKSQGIGVWYADVTTTTCTWHAQSRGIEQLVTKNVLCPPGGPALVAALDRAVYVVGEVESAPTFTIRAVPDVPLGSPANLEAVLTAGYPTVFTYAWTITAAPGGSTAAIVAPTLQNTTIAPDVAGTYTAQLTITNSAGATTHTTTFATAARVAALSLPGANGNYISTPDAAAFRFTRSFRIRIKCALTTYVPATTDVPLVLKQGTTAAWMTKLRPSTGLNTYLSENSTGSLGAFGLNLGTVTGPLTSFADGALKWLEIQYDYAAQLVWYRWSNDGTTWTTIGSATSAQIGTNDIFSGSEPVTIGFRVGLNGESLTGRVYQVMLYDATDTLVGHFNAEAVTRTAARTPVSMTDELGVVWSGVGSLWDWV